MVDVLPLSRAARAAGVSRSALQAKIEAGELTSFEGMVRLDDLLRVFPAAQVKDSPTITRMQRIKEAALSKPMPDDSPSEFASLRARVGQLENDLREAQTHAAGYRDIIDTMAGKLLEVQEGCDERQRALLQTVLTWLFGQIDQRQR